MRKWLACCLTLALFAIPAMAQQTGSISGKVVSSDGEALPGVTVEATSNVLPQARATVTAGNGEFRLPLLPPGNYELTFSLAGLTPAKRNVAVALQANTAVSVTMTPEAISESIEITAAATLVDTTSPELSAAVSSDVIAGLPVGQEYRDLVKLIPGVQYTEDAIRGPSAGGSGQDNVYKFDGVNVNLPLFGTLSAEPSSHDIDQISVVKGGANATDFNRSAGFSVNSISKSGTNQFKGSLSYKAQTESMTATRETVSASVFEEDKSWLVANVGGPIFKERLFFYASYYAPNTTRQNRSNFYGEVPDYEVDRDEYFGKLSYSPTNSMMLHGSYRTSDRTDVGTSVSGQASAGSTSLGAKATLDIAILEGSWVINSNSFASFKVTDFANETASLPDNLFGFGVYLDGSSDLNIGALDTMGQLTVPVPLSGQTAFNAFIDPYIQRYGYVDGNGAKVGGGRVGGYSEINNQDFFRRSYQGGYDFSFGDTIQHELHLGYQWFRDSEELNRFSNGWGLLTVPGGRINCPANSTCAGQPIYFQAQVQQQGILTADGTLVPTIESSYVSQNFEINDVIRLDNLTLNFGLLVSNDQLYGQGLRPVSGNSSGFALSKGHKYKMYELSYGDTFQPRLGAVWAYDGSNTLFANIARYIPAASSLPRAASWARNSAALINAYFDQNGNFIGSSPEASSSGKFFQDNLDPRTVDEYMIGTSRSLGHGWSTRAQVRYRYGYNYWEDTENDSRLRYLPPAGIPQELYIGNLAQVRGEIGGSSYVIAELDGSFTKYWEAGLEAEWRGSKAYFRGSYVWSHYYGNFDQDNTTSNTLNDGNIFIGSSNIADGAGRQLWNFKYGNLHGDRRHQLKLYGYYTLPWHASLGAYGIYQSGQPWEATDVEVYRALTASTSNTNRYAEPAGSRTTDAHYQIDLNYTQDIPIGSRFNLQARVDVFNVLDNQTGYNPQEIRTVTSTFGQAQSFYDPRRFQLALKFEF